MRLTREELVMNRKQKGFGIIEGLIIIGILVVLGALIFVAVAPQPAKTTTKNKAESSSSVAPASIEDVKADQKEIEANNDTDIDQELDALTSDLENL